LFAQLFDRESCTYTYLLADAYSKDAVLIDPVIELIERDLEVVGELGLNIRYACNNLLRLLYK
jgi:sulfur dioxygenase